VLAASSDLFSAQHSGQWLGEIILRIVGHPLPPREFHLVHFLIRKSAHLTEYFILGALCFRAVRGDARGWSARWAVVAVALAAAVAITDEWHQFFVMSRTSSGWDVLLDAVGAALAQWVAWSRGRGVSG
jgi:VanZ family protein